MSKFSVAIVGGGIGGVTLALALSKHSNIHFDIYESAGAFEEIGAGVTIFGRSLFALADMGVVDYLEKINTPTGSERTWILRKADILPEGYILRKADTLPEGYDFCRGFSRPQIRGTGSYPRYDFLSLIISLLPERIRKECVHFRKRLTRYEQDANGVTLHFTDGTTASSDLLIGADGIKSPTRLTLYEELAAAENGEEKLRMLKYAIPRWTGLVAYRGLVPAEEAEKELGRPHRCTQDRMMYIGKEAHLAVYPIAKGKLINVSAYVFAQPKTGDETDQVWPAEVPWVEQVSPDDMLKAYEGFEDQVMALLKCIKTPSRWAIHHLDPLPFYTHKRVALLGDAAHATLPHQGQGANQSIEDAYTLAVILGSPHTTKANIARALKAYERARLSRGNEVIRLSSKTAQLYHLAAETEDDDLAAVKAFTEGTERQWLFIGTPQEAAEEAISWMMAGTQE